MCAFGKETTSFGIDNWICDRQERGKRMDLFESIPNEIVEEVLRFAVTAKNLTSLKLVCKRFKSLVDIVYDHNEPKGKHFQWNLQCEHHLEVARLLQDDRILAQVDQYHYLYYAVCFGELDTVELLVNDPRTNPNLGLDYHPIAMAYIYGKMDVFEFLLAHPRVTLPSFYDIENIVSKENCPGLLTRLLCSGRVVVSRYQLSRMRLSASQQNNTDLLQFLITNFPCSGGDIADIITSLGTPLHVMSSICCLIMDYHYLQPLRKRVKSA